MSITNSLETKLILNISEDNGPLKPRAGSTMIPVTASHEIKEYKKIIDRTLAAPVENNAPFLDLRNTDVVDLTTTDAGCFSNKGDSDATTILEIGGIANLSAVWNH